MKLHWKKILREPKKGADDQRQRSSSVVNMTIQNDEAEIVAAVQANVALST